MCGVCGVAYADRAHPVDTERLARMTRSLIHRGPDSEGFHRMPGIGLGVRRLSIVDLATGDQPLANEDGTIVVVCNGEIYNHVELREELIAAGHRFRSSSDVEVIVHLYEEHGEAFVDRLRGMFGLALWDARSRRLLLARDRLGIKPLHYALTADGLVFGSEQKAILASGLVPAEPDLHALRQVLTYGRVIAPRTMVAGIQRLLPGHLLVWCDGRAQLRQYWDVRFPAREDYDRRTTDEGWAEGLRAELAESVRLHLRSDVPVGAALSAGIDSSSVVALTAGMSADPVRTFTLRFEEAAFDELRNQRGLDDFPQYRLIGHRSVCRRSELAHIPQAIWHSEDMLGIGPVLGLMMVAKAASAHVKVIMTGEGSDELFGGYSWYPTMRVLAPLLALPRALRALPNRIGAIRRRWPGAAHLLNGAATMGFERYSNSITHLPSQSGASRVLAPDVLALLARDEPIDDAPPLPEAFASWHPFAQLQYFDLKHRMVDSVVQGLDRSTMAHSVEARVPFLDHHVVEYSARIPPRVKMKRLTEKYVLRRAMTGTLPAEIAWRRKHAFSVPIGTWLRAEIPPSIEALIAEPALADAGYFCPAKVRALRERHRQGAEDVGQLLASVLGMQAWDTIFRRPATGTIEAPCATS